MIRDYTWEEWQKESEFPDDIQWCRDQARDQVTYCYRTRLHRVRPGFYKFLDCSLRLREAITSIGWVENEKDFKFDLQKVQEAAREFWSMRDWLQRLPLACEPRKYR